MPTRIRDEAWEAIAFIKNHPVAWLHPGSGAVYQHVGVDMPFMPPAHEYEEHRKLRLKLGKFKWSLAELEWLQAHAKNWPASLESLVVAKLAEARKERKDADLPVRDLESDLHGAAPEGSTALL